MNRPGKRDSERVYERPLPGGGFVAIEVTPVRNFLGQRKYHGAVVVEQRAEQEERGGDAALRVAEAHAATVATVFHELFPVAQSNTAVAAGLLAQKPRGGLLSHSHAES